MGLIRTQSLARCLAFAARKAATIDRAFGFSASATASSRSKMTMSAAPPVAFSIFRSLSPGANSHDRALRLSPGMVIIFPRLDRSLSEAPAPASVGFGQFQDLLGQVVQDHVRAHGRGPGNQALAQVALDMIFLRIAHAAQSQH